MRIGYLAIKLKMMCLGLINGLSRIICPDKMKLKKSLFSISIKIAYGDRCIIHLFDITITFN
jgi:hypothetical protein